MYAAGGTGTPRCECGMKAPMSNVSMCLLLYCSTYADRAGRDGANRQHISMHKAALHSANQSSMTAHFLNPTSPYCWSSCCEREPHRTHPCRC